MEIFRTSMCAINNIPELCEFVSHINYIRLVRYSVEVSDSGGVLFYIQKFLPYLHERITFGPLMDVFNSEAESLTVLPNAAKFVL